MAPFNLSDLAVKEIKIPSSHLRPAQEKNYLGKYLTSHFLDFWALFFINATANFMVKSTFESFMSTRGLNSAWESVNFSPVDGFMFMAYTFAYFFSSYFMNNGQTAGMKIMKCRIRMNEHNFSESLRWTLKSFATYATFGLVSKRFSGSMAPHDHLWHELVAQKEMAAPDVRTLTPAVEEEVKLSIAA
ncbi:MAG: hypothetical protein V4598_11405 [Bdellovibrionota bacterium]